MITAIFSTIFLFFLFKIIERDNDSIGFAVPFASTVLPFGIVSIGQYLIGAYIPAFGEYLQYVLILFYVLIPWTLFSSFCGLSRKKSAIYTVVVVTTLVAFEWILSATLLMLLD